MRRHAATAALLGVTAAVAAVFLIRFEPARLLVVETVRPAMAALIVLLAIVAAGSCFDRLSDRLAFGFAIFGTIAAIAAWISVAIVPWLTVAGACAGAWLLSRRRLAPPARPPVLLVLPAALAFVEAITPVNSPDELVYKLAVPHAWQLFGRMVELPLNSNSYLAMAAASTDLAALTLGGGIAAKLVHFAVYLAVLAILRRVGGDRAAIIVAWTPALMLIAGWAWVEWSVLGLLLLSYERYELDDSRGCGLALGAAIACKYTALPWLFAFAIVLLWRRRDWLLRVGAYTALAGAFFYLRNLIWTGSPIAPLLLPNAPQVSNYRGGNVWLAFFRGADILDPAFVDESLGILLPVAAIAGLFAWRRRRDLVLIGAIQLPIVVAFAPGSRNMIDAVAPLGIAGAALLNFDALIAVVALLQATVVTFSLESYDLVPYLAGRETATQYIARTRSFARPYAWIARNTPPDARILLLGENRTFYLDRRFFAAGNLDSPRLAAWLARFDDAEAKRLGLTHILIHKPWYRVGTAPMGMLEKEYVLEIPLPTHERLMQYLATHASLRYRDADYLIYVCRDGTSLR